VKILWSREDINVEISGFALGIAKCGLDYDVSDVEG
jgi:hypothetical protein